MSQDREDLGKVVGPGNRPHPRIYRQLIDDVAWPASIELVGALKDCGLAGLIGKRATEDQCSILHTRMKVGRDRGA
jgi:hypothetical protein